MGYNPTTGLFTNDLVPLGHDDMNAATRFLGAGAVPAPVFGGALVVDAHRLRAYGARLDGVHDDAPAVQKAIDTSPLHTAAVLAQPAVVIELPAGCALGLGSPVQSTHVHTLIRGAGPSVSGIVRLPGATGSVMWQHGAVGDESSALLHIQDVTLADTVATGSGATGLSVRMTPSAPQKCFSMERVAFRCWTAPVRLANLTRGPAVHNVTVFGPDFAIQDGAGFDIVSDGGGSYDGHWHNVMVANYRWAWRYTASAPLEGQVFVGCNGYNGWGLLQVAVSAPGDYKALLWSLTDCDWQGYGCGLDLTRCRLVTVRGGYWIANTNPPSAPPNGAPRRRYLSFKACENVRLHGLELDVLPGQTDLVSLIHVDGNCIDVAIRDTTIRAFSACYAGIESEGNASTNTVTELNSCFFVWSGGPKVLDLSSNQALQTAADNAVWPSGTVGLITMLPGNTFSGQGKRQIDVRTGTLTADSNGLVGMFFPTRVGGASWFLGGPPVVTVSVVNGNANVPTPSIYAVSTTALVLSFGPAQAGLQVQIEYRATGV